MGASTWTYYVPYQPDVEKALGELRQDVFRDRRYQDGDVPFDTAAADALEDRMASVLESLSPEQRRMWELTQGMLVAARERAKAPARPRAGTIEELRQRCGEAGTHSILDVDRVAASPAYGAISRLPPARLRKLLGTDRPTRAQVESAFQGREWAEFRRRWQGLYIVIYADDEPSEIFFAGTSGD